MSSVKIVKCVVQDVNPGLISGEITYEASFSDTEVRLNLGFIPTLSVQPSNHLTTATKVDNALNNSKTGYRKVVPIPLKPVRPEGQLVVSRTETFQVAKDSLFVDLSPAQIDNEQRITDYFKIAPWSKATAWLPLYAGLDAWLDLSLDIGPSRADSSDLQFVNRAPPPPLTAVTTTARSAVVGGPGGTAFDEPLPANTTQLNRLLIRAGGVVYSIRAEWKSTSGQLTLGAEHGGCDAPIAAVSSIHECVFETGEFIAEVSGAWGQQREYVYSGTSSPDGPVVVRRIQFVTSTGRRIGPFGYSPSSFEKPFSFTGLKVVGFFGRSSGALDQLGFISRVDGVAAPTNSATPTLPTATPTALAFNGVDTYIEVNAALPITTQSTIEMWMSGVPKEAFLFFLTDAAHRRQLSAHVPYSDGNVYFDSGADASNNYDRIVKAVTPIDDKSTWNHWAFVRNSASGRMAIYRNGVLWHEQATGMTRAMASCNRLIIAADGDGLWYHSGAISEIRLWNVERTVAQINDNMKRVIPGADTGLIASYSLDGYQVGQSIIDRSGGGRNGIVRGTAVSVPGPSALLK